jgi:hypothetical protein
MEEFEFFLVFFLMAEKGVNTNEKKRKRKFSKNRTETGSTCVVQISEKFSEILQPETGKK